MDKRVLNAPPPLPATKEAWDALRDIKAHITLNDRVESHHQALLADDTVTGDERPVRDVYSSFLYAVGDEQAVEGSLTDDDHVAARMIKNRAIEKKDMEVGTQKIATIKKALRIVLRRYHQSRKERKNMIGGEILPDDNNSE